MDPQAIRAHDLLWLTDTASLELDGAWPAWLTAEWLARAPLVVRRESTVEGRVPVGVRGMARSERCKGFIRRADIARRVRPEMLRNGDGGAPALDALAALAPALDALGLAWGPTGGAGFQQACGLPVLRPDSDLDLLVRAPLPLNAAQAEVLDCLQHRTACRIDIQIDTGGGAFAFAEWRRTAGRVLLKTGAGPLLTDDPWRATA
jgi:phosphoribosyl-dephospho-CoA transferase